MHKSLNKQDKSIKKHLKFIFFRDIMGEKGKVTEMKYISLEDAYTEDFGIFSVLAFPQRWNDGSVYRMPEKGRPDSGFMFITDCKNTMLQSGKKIEASVGQIVYLPMGAKYEARFCAKCNSRGKKGNVTNYLLNFVLRDFNGELLNLSEDIRVITPKDSGKLAEMFRSICENGIYSPINIKTLAYSIIGEISRQTRESVGETGKNRTFFKAAEYIGEHCLKREIKVSELAEICHVSQATLRRIFLSESGMPPKDYINSLRLERAKTLLRGGVSEVCEVAEMCGFDDPSYFSRFFKKHTGMTPGEYI